MEKATSDAMHRRIFPLLELEKAIDRDMNESCLLIQALQREDEEQRSTSKARTFSSLIRWTDPKGRERSLRAFVKMIYADPLNVTIPTTFLNELYLMKTIVRDMVKYGRSPHFIFPITQVYGSEKVSDLRFLANALRENSDRGCRTDDGRIGVYNVMEYFDPQYFINLEDLLYVQDLSNDDLVRYLKEIFFQVFYNLSVMENLKFRHGDLHLKNILIGFIDPSAVRPIIYSLDSQTHYKVSSRASIYFIDFDRSSVYQSPYQTNKLTEEELKSFPCISADRMDQLPEGLKEGCWEWNPHADWTRLLSAFSLELSKAKGSEFAAMVMDQKLFSFPSIYAYFTAVLGDVRVYKFGRPSRKELSEKLPEGVLRQTTPGSILRAYARQFSSESWLQVLKVPEPGMPVFKAY